VRPKKRIVLLDPSEGRQSILRYLLRTNGYHVISASSPTEAWGAFLDDNPDLLLACWASPSPEEEAAMGSLLDQIHTERRGIPTVLLADDLREAPQRVVCERTLLKGLCDSATILDHCKLMTGRKRGPMPGSVDPPKKPVRSAALNPAMLEDALRRLRERRHA
jgi:CheY-like chemotaxis protein